MKGLGVFLDGPVHRRATPSNKFADTHLYSWVERGALCRVLFKTTTQSLWPVLETAPLDPETSELTMRHRASIVLRRKKRKCEDSFIILLTVCQKFTKICGEIEKERKRWIAEVLLFISQEISTNLPTKSCKVNYKKPFCRPLADWRTGDKEEIIERDGFLFLDYESRTFNSIMIRKRNFR